jgi:acid stress-induced BolA-like protein IbaG/YrbA
MQSGEIRQLIESGLPGATVEVAGADGRHFEAVIVASAFEGKSMVQQHQMVYRILGERMGSEIHALSLKTMTPREFNGESGG